MDLLPFEIVQEFAVTVMVESGQVCVKDEMLGSLCLSLGMQQAGNFAEMRLPFASNTDQTASPMPSILGSFAIPLIDAPLGSFLRLPGRKSLLSGLTDWLAPESQMTLKEFVGSMAALHATGCCKTTASEKRHSVFAGFGELAGVPVGVPVGV